MAEFRRVLISNRGEIAIRIAKAASALGIESVGVYARADSLSLHTRLVSEVREIGDGTTGDPVRAYLSSEELLRVAHETGCDCVHPGYGFLAENAAFAQRCADEGLAFIGPSAAALALFGDKIRARALAESLEIPVVPGTDTPLGTAVAAQVAADAMGHPVMLKAASGGGGRGMRSVTGPDGVADAYERCRSEAEAAFGDGTLFMEKIIERPRHIEVQVLADAAGTAIHLHERDCSIQQRHQKVVEIAPAPGLDEALRERLYADSIKLVQAAGLTNAATVEFLVSPETDSYYFIECNPRLQVEHTVTEQICDVDLVEAQFRIAGGNSLGSQGLDDQSAVGVPRGFAVQARVMARGVGTLSAYKEPSGPGVRVDACGYLGYAPPPQFDPLLAKVVGWSLARGTTRAGMTHFEAALDRTRRALDEFHIGGLATNVPLLQDILADPVVRAGGARTTFLDDSFARPGPQSATGSPALALLRQQAILAGVSEGVAAGPMPAQTTVAALPVGSGQQAVTSSMGGLVSEVRAREGDRVAAGEALLVVSAMKMESLVAAPLRWDPRSAPAARDGGQCRGGAGHCRDHAGRGLRHRGCRDQ